MPEQVEQNLPIPVPKDDGSTASRIARLLVGAGLVTEEQIRYALRVREKLPHHRALVDILEELGHVTKAQVRDALRARPLEVPLGEILLEMGFVRDVDLRAALAQQAEKPGTRLGRVLIDNRVLHESELCEALSLQSGFEHLHVDPATCANLVIETGVPAALLRQHGIAPVARRGKSVVVALSDPHERAANDVARKLFGQGTILGLGSPTAIEDALLRVELAKGSRPAAVEENFIVGTVNQMILDAAMRGASDIHIEPTRDELRVRLRVDGVLAPYKVFSLNLAPMIASRIKVLAGADITERRRHQDGRIAFERGDLQLDIRFSSYVTLHGETLVLRLLNNRKMMLTLDEVGLAPRVLERFREDALDCPSGVIVVTGPTGSGKTTTLYAALDYLNSPTTSIITAEDPVEYVIDGIAQCSLNQKANVGYEETLRHMMRQDPDIIVIGEIRDTLSAETAIQAALTGHKVLTTFHTEDSIGGLMRLLNMNIEAFLISSTVVSVVAQRLLRKVCEACSEERPITAQQARRFGYEPRELTPFKVREGRGCPACAFTGYKGRIAVFELLVLNELVKEALIERRPSFEIRRISTESSGLVTLAEEGIVRAINGKTTLEEVLRMLPRLSKPRPIESIRRLLGE